MNQYDHNKIEKKWQNVWEKKKPNKVKENPKLKKFYALIEFPYPSGAGLHVGHPRSYVAMDIIARKRRAEGFNVLYPIGWDAFGLPTENFAIKTGIHPAKITKDNIKIFTKQIKSLGVSFDWSREIDTTDPKYYKWTQWIFLQFFNAGLAYKKKMTINWCPVDMIGLANEEVINGCCERCGNVVEKKEKEQWMLAITKYADRLDKDLDETDFIEKVKIQQRNWIGKSEGALVKFKILNSNEYIEVFTTRIDTIFSGTYLILAPEHKLIKEFSNQITNLNEVSLYQKKVSLMTEIDRTNENKEITGIQLNGLYVENPATGEKMPVCIADFVLEHYGTGAVFADAHDKRDFDLAKKINLPLKVSIKPKNEVDFDKINNLEICYEGEGILFNSSQFDGLSSEEARPKIISWLNTKGLAEIKTNYKLKDWIFSRQRYWGEPIPIVHCEKCGIVPIPEKELPLKLPNIKNYEPTQNGESPLASITKWVNTKCPNCKGKAKRETDTMPNWAGSSWYYLRFMDSKNNKAFAGKDNLKYWNQVDWYNGGMEHTTLHLLYSRFWHKFLFDQGLVPTSEPYKKRTSHGMILAEGGEKMSKSRGNVINPDESVKAVGADTLRIYEMFMGPFDQAIAWDTNNIAGARRFVEKVWKIQEYVSESTVNNDLEILIHKTIKKVSEDIEEMKFNTAISSMMIVVNEFEKVKNVSKDQYKILLRLLAPFAPHFTEEIWSILKNKNSIHSEEWPKYNPDLLESDTKMIVIQINGKVRGTVKANNDISESDLRKQIEDIPEIHKWIVNQEIKKVVFIKGKLLNIVV